MGSHVNDMNWKSGRAVGLYVGFPEQRAGVRPHPMTLAHLAVSALLAHIQPRGQHGKRPMRARWSAALLCISALSFLNGNRRIFYVRLLTLIPSLDGHISWCARASDRYIGLAENHGVQCSMNEQCVNRPTARAI